MSGRRVLRPVRPVPGGGAGGAPRGASRRHRRPLLAPVCVTPPATGPGVCRTCRGPAGPGFDRCWSCGVVRRTLGSRLCLPPVVPISVFTPGTELHRVLVAYKSGSHAAERADAAHDVAELVATFLSRHGRCLARGAGGGWDVIDVVPSTRRTGPAHPLAVALGALTALGGRIAPLLSRGPDRVSHLEPAPGAFTASAAAAGRRVLLLDDVFTTGAHALSAAAALHTAGATVVAVVPVGRLVHTDQWPGSYWWERVCAAGGTPVAGALDRCAECQQK